MLKLSKSLLSRPFWSPRLFETRRRSTLSLAQADRPYNGVQLTVEASVAWEDNLVRSNFSSTLDEKVKLFQSENRNAVWLKLSGDAGSLVSIARQHSFLYHHCKDDYIMLTRWLPEDVPNKIPAYGTHQVGVGGLVLDKDGRILLVKERGGLPGVSWKLPGGLTDSGEDFGDAACREVFEETGIECEFRNILCFRHQHGLGFGKSDLYAICYLQANRSLDIDFDPVEIEAATWMPLQDFAKTTKHPMMKKVFDMFLPSRSNQDITVGVPMVETEMRYLKNRPPFKFYMAEQEWKRSGGNSSTASIRESCHVSMFEGKQ